MQGVPYEGSTRVLRTEALRLLPMCRVDPVHGRRGLRRL